MKAKPIPKEKRVIIWILLMLSVLNAALSFVALGANHEIREFARHVYKRDGLGIGAPVGCLLAVSGFAVLGCWIAYAIQVGDWRFAAIPAITSALSYIGKAMYRMGRKAA